MDSVLGFYTCCSCCLVCQGVHCPFLFGKQLTYSPRLKSDIPFSAKFSPVLPIKHPSSSIMALNLHDDEQCLLCVSLDQKASCAVWRQPHTKQCREQVTRENDGRAKCWEPQGTTSQGPALLRPRCCPWPSSLTEVILRKDDKKHHTLTFFFLTVLS